MNCRSEPGESEREECLRQHGVSVVTLFLGHSGNEDGRIELQGGTYGEQHHPVGIVAKHEIGRGYQEERREGLDVEEPFQPEVLALVAEGESADGHTGGTAGIEVGDPRQFDHEQRQSCPDDNSDGGNHKEHVASVLFHIGRV